MGSRLSITSAPVIMTETFLETKIVQNILSTQDLDASELHKLLQIDGLEPDLVCSLDLEHQNLVNIDELWRFKFLTKLELPNNYIEKIEGLNELTNLQHLDLSFNFIKHICNLENLLNLTTLCLSSNEILVLENMESLKKLENFLIRSNKIQSFDNVYYLTQFHNLSSLAIDRNPFVDQEDVKLHIIAVLPQLKYLDFILVSSAQIQEAYCMFPHEKEKRSCIEEADEKKFTCGFPHSDKEAYVEGLANGQGFQSLLLSDKNYQALCCSPLATEISECFSTKMSKIFDDWHKSGHEFYEEILHERSEFLLMVSKAKEYCTEIFKEEESKFIDFKENIPKELCYIYHVSNADDEKIKNILKMKKMSDDFFQKTFRNFMNTSCLYVDLITNMCRTFEKKIHVINEKYVQEVSNFSGSIMNLNKDFSGRLEQLYLDAYNSGPELLRHLHMDDKELTTNDLTLLQLIKKKELIKASLEISVRIHSTMLNERINHLKVNLERNLVDIINQISEETFMKQAEFNRNIVIFCNKQKYFIDKLFSKNNIFEQYFGYIQQMM